VLFPLLSHQPVQAYGAAKFGIGQGAGAPAYTGTCSARYSEGSCVVSAERETRPTFEGSECSSASIAKSLARLGGFEGPATEIATPPCDHIPRGGVGRLVGVQPN